MTWKEAQSILASTLEQTHDARELKNISHIYFQDRFGKTRLQTLELSENDNIIFRKDLAMFEEGMPVQYIVGKSNFFGYFFKVNQNVLIPRAETEELLAFSLDRIRKMETDNTSLKVLDIGTGSACIPIVLKKKETLLELWAIDKSNNALTVARENASLHQVDIQFIELDFLEESQWDKLPAFDLIVSNPPYIDPQEKVKMTSSVLSFEPEMALFPQHEDVDIFYKKIFQFAETHLNSKGEICVEINEYRQLQLVEYANRLVGYSNSIHYDLQGKARILHLKKK